MKRTVLTTAVIASLLAGVGASAAERTVTLAVDNMTCEATCPYIVRQALTRVSGVARADVLFEEKHARVTFDDTKTDVTALTKATADVGFPSREL